MLRVLSLCDNGSEKPGSLVDRFPSEWILVQVFQFFFFLVSEASEIFFENASAMTGRSGEDRFLL
jgi:hypothetical protein